MITLILTFLFSTNDYDLCHMAQASKPLTPYTYSAYELPALDIRVECEH